MVKSIAAGGLFKPVANRNESKADATTTAARAILDAEVNQREAKTAKLRALREQREAAAEPAAEPARPKRRKAAAAK